MAEHGLVGAHGAGAHAVHALRAEESELVLREAVEALAALVVDLQSEALELRQVETLRQRRAEVRERLLIRVVLREVTPRLPRRPLVVFVERRRGVAPARVARVDRRREDERARRDDEVGRGVVGALERDVADAEADVDLAELQERMSDAQREIR